ncbi:phasin family protein [Luteimonas sp. FCS-9]|uniref:phasin family protein n=1 Tax=Luteimonas sp. FCS-9 TaxID=1547516 RepID=UPI00069B3E80|nr:phasin family protein [Luteimonas sp. FCS-9]
MRDATGLPLQLLKANLELQLQIARLIQESGQQWADLANRAVGDGLAERDAEIRELLRAQDWQALATLPADAFWRQLQQRAGDSQELARIATSAQSTFASGLTRALQAWQQATADALGTGAAPPQLDDAWRAALAPWETLLSAFAPPSGGTKRGGTRGG